MTITTASAQEVLDSMLREARIKEQLELLTRLTERVKKGEIMGLAYASIDDRDGADMKWYTKNTNYQITGAVSLLLNRMYNSLD